MALLRWGSEFGLGFPKFGWRFCVGIRIQTWWVLGSRIWISWNPGKCLKAEFELWLIKSRIRIGRNPGESSRTVWNRTRVKVESSQIYYRFSIRKCIQTAFSCKSRKPEIQTTINSLTLTTLNSVLVFIEEFMQLYGVV